MAMQASKAMNMIIKNISSSDVKDDQATNFPIREINLDDNGLKDISFAWILQALSS